MSLARWDPFLELKSLESQINRLFRRPFPWAARPDEALATPEFAPPADIYEDENKIAFKMEVPGIDPKDLDVRIEGNTLTVTGERKFKTEEKKENFRRIEGSYGWFCRSFALPPSADSNNIHANFNNGVLEINVPKRAEARGKQIRIEQRAGTTEKQPKAA
jgi:HSP20 family protein